MKRKKIRNNHILKDLPKNINFDCSWILQFGDNENDTKNMRNRNKAYDPTVYLTPKR